jgi:hypothetical protein
MKAIVDGRTISSGINSPYEIEELSEERMKKKNVRKNSKFTVHIT